MVLQLHPVGISSVVPCLSVSCSLSVYRDRVLYLLTDGLTAKKSERHTEDWSLMRRDSSLKVRSFYLNQSPTVDVPGPSLSFPRFTRSRPPLPPFPRLDLLSYTWTRLTFSPESRSTLTSGGKISLVGKERLVVLSDYKLSRQRDKSLRLLFKLDFSFLFVVSFFFVGIWVTRRGLISIDPQLPPYHRSLW